VHDGGVVPQDGANRPALGLSEAEAAARLRRDGPNAIGGEGRRTLVKILVAQVASPLVLILVAASLVSLAVGEDVNAAIILAIVVLSAALGFVQEARSETAIAALQARLALQATVVRDGEPRAVPVHDVVLDDLVVLGAGAIVPADGRVVEADHLYVDEASLTGESAPAPKAAGSAGQDPAEPDARSALVFFGTSVVSGTGRAVITATGARTSYGAIASRLAERAPENDFQRGVRAFGGLVFRVTTILVVAVLAINLALHRPLVDSLLFAIALAVGLTPELLPAIVTLNLTQGARSLSQSGVLVKRLPAIQNLGSVTVLCTDKTGTLTAGKLGVVRSVGLDRDDAAEAAWAMELAYLNSHFQTGFTNPLDAAILADTPQPADLATYRKLAELPYDFKRRLLSVVVAHGTEPPLLVTKGAPEAVLQRAGQVRGADAVRTIGPAEHDRLARLVAEASSDGFRLVAVGSRALAPAEVDIAPAGPSGGPGHLAEPDAVERDLVFEGLILFSDPPKEGVGETIAQLARDGVALKVVTGDNDLVARHVAGQVGLKIDGVLTGEEMRGLRHEALVARARRTTIFARVDPDQKLQVIRALRESGAVVGYLGDGINDAPALHEADVGISVDNATDVARSAADIILLEPSLAAIHQGVLEGRRTFANTLKYIRMGTSSNFGNMLSMTGAALLLPFLPMTPGQILLNNLIYDASQTAIPTDTVDPEVTALPARWDVHAIQRFMLVFGPISSLFDFATFGALLLVLGANEQAFQTGWFIESLFTQVLVVLVIRTRVSPFWRSRPSRPLMGAIAAALAGAVLIPLSPLGGILGFAPLPLAFWPMLIALVGVYLGLVELVKRRVEPRAAKASPQAPSPGSAPGRHPARQLAGQGRERQGPVPDELVVEAPQVEGRAVTGRQLRAQPPDLAQPGHVAQGLPGPADVAVRLDHGVRLGQAGPEELVDRLLPGPAQAVHPGVHDQPRRAPRLRVQHAEALARVAVQAVLVGETLRVQAPALDVRPADQARPEAPEGVEARVLHLEGDLEVVARDGLVVRRRGQLGVGPAGQVVGVDVVDAGPGAVHRGRVVVGEGDVLLLVALHRPDHAARDRQPPEDARRDLHGAADVLGGPGDQLLAGRGAVRGIRVERTPERAHVVAVPLGPGDRPPLLVDHRELVEAHAMDVGRLHVQRGPGADGVAIQREAVGRGDEPRLLAGRREVLAGQRLEEPAVGRVDDVAQDLAHQLAVRLGGDPCAHGDRRRLDGDRQETVELVDGPLGDDPRRGPARRPPFVEHPDRRVDGRAVRPQPRQEGIEPRRRVGGLELGDLRDLELDALHVVHGTELVEAPVVTLDGDVGHDPEHVRRDPLLDREAIRGHLGDLASDALREGPHRRAALRSGVLEESVVPLVAVDRGGGRLEREEVLPEADGDLVDAGGGFGHGAQDPHVQAESRGGAKPRDWRDGPASVPPERGA
jgi:Mg2+-importing ATPase